MAKTKTFRVGDLVRYTTTFRRSIGMATGKVDGVVVGHGSLGPFVLWHDEDWPMHINAFNLQSKKTTRSRDALVLAARGALGIPLGEAGTFRVYAGKKRPKLHNKYATYKAAENAAYGPKGLDEKGEGFIILNEDGFVVAGHGPMPQPDNAASRRRGRNPKSKSGTRKINSHDPQQSTKRFEAAMEAADRDLAAASTALEDGRMSRSVELLTRTTYWLGTARAERAYAGRVDKYYDKRLKSLEKDMKAWSGDLSRWVRENYSKKKN